MTTTTDPVIVPSMNVSRTGVALWTPTGPRIVHTEGDTSPVGPHTGGNHIPLLSPIKGHTGPVGPHIEGHTSHTSNGTSPVGTHTQEHDGTVGTHTGNGTSHTVSHTEGNTGTVGTDVGTHTAPDAGTVGTHTQGDTSPTESHTSTDTGTVGTAVGTHVGTHSGTPADETRGTARMHISEAHRTEVAALPSKAEQIRHICAVLGNPDTVEVHAWLEACGVEASRKYVSRIVNEWRDAHGLEDTGTFRVLTDAALAELDGRAEPDDEDQEDTEESAESDAEAAEYAAELAARVRAAKARLPLQSEEALYAALSDEEMAKERELAEAEREAAREIRRRRMAAELANAKRDQATAEAIAKSEAADARWLQRARSKKRRLTSEDAKLAQLTRNSEWSSRALIAAVGLGMAWSAVNAQKNLVPSGDMTDPLYWLSYGVEALISLPLIIIMVASTTATRWGRTAPPEEKRKVLAVELVLLATTLTLNVGKHLTPPEGQDINWLDVFKFGVAPVMVGVLLQVHAWVSNHYANLIMASEQAPGATQSDDNKAGK